MCGVSAPFDGTAAVPGLAPTFVFLSLPYMYVQLTFSLVFNIRGALGFYLKVW